MRRTPCASSGTIFSLPSLPVTLGLPLFAEHERDVRAVDIGVKESDPLACRGERRRQVGGDGRLADAALAGANGDNVGNAGRELRRGASVPGPSPA